MGCQSLDMPVVQPHAKPGGLNPMGLEAAWAWKISMCSKREVAKQETLSARQIKMHATESWLKLGGRNEKENPGQ